ncbi:serine/threonine protein kinase [Paenibacillus sp. V4I9]|uniref:serine/threonine protein kinase n=1 Tax=Paenibacillus sp. V4I9 TaxID=3042308 RepID=UPI00277F1DD2|nr:serine/threonine-protein kinase [Paenibacillus sp. V4I9]MDQ0885027.1 serine/threonine protein kinase [Paenibacillus sp. V4I9]
MEEFEKDKLIKLINGDEISIVSKLGEGGQGIVYKVEYKEKEYALKWYHHSYLKGMSEKDSSNESKFYKNLVSNATMGNPAKAFLWPLAITEIQDGSFGYIMELRPAEYQSFVKLLNAAVRFKSTSAVINATINMVTAFQALHRKGYSYQDLNDGNFFVNPVNGDVLICDNDNVAPYGDGFGIGGKSRYMAPEVVLGKSRPNLDTDLFSLSVVLFMFYFLSHPLEGTKVASCPCLTDESEKKFYASEPIFVCDPNDTSNRPVRGIHNNVINLWPLFPNYLQDAFIRAFTKGSKEIDQRIMEAEWKKIFYRLKDDILPCPKCGEENFSSLVRNDIVECCECNNKINKPLSFSGKDYEIALFPGKNITEWHAYDGNYSKIVGSVVQNKSNPNLWGIRNVSDKLWLVNYPNGEEKTVKQNEVIPVLKDICISFGNKKGFIK